MSNSDPKLPFGTRFCRCAACGAYFTTESGFALHRIGTMQQDRRCMTADEMRAAGLEPNPKGYWRKPGSPFASQLEATIGADPVPEQGSGGIAAKSGEYSTVSDDAGAAP